MPTVFRPNSGQISNVSSLKSTSWNPVDYKLRRQVLCLVFEPRFVKLSNRRQDKEHGIDKFINKCPPDTFREGLKDGICQIQGVRGGVIDGHLSDLNKIKIGKTMCNFWTPENVASGAKLGYIGVKFGPQKMIFETIFL